MRLTNFRLPLTAAVVAALAACSGGFPSGGGALPSAGAARVSSAGRLVAARAAVAPSVAHGDLYVADEATIREFRTNDPTPVRTIDEPGVKTGLEVDAAGNLYVANATTHTVSEYAPGSRIAERTVHTGRDGPNVFALEGSGGGWLIGNGGNGWTGDVAEYGPIGNRPVREITDGIDNPRGIDVDSAGNAYILNGGHGGHGGRGGNGGASVEVFPAGSTQPAERITKDIVQPSAMVLGESGALYVANNGSKADEQTVVEFPAGGTQPIQTYPEPRHAGVEVVEALSPGGGLAVGAGDEVLVYLPGSKVVERTVTSKIDDPVAMVFNHAGDLYVADSSENAVTEYGPGKVEVAQAIVTPSPVDLAFGP